jgi:hydrogenase maturation protease
MSADAPSTPPRVLVIGYGNELRCDDGLGPKLAAAFRDLALGGVETLACHQLTPELAEPISTADAVVFVDASVDEPREVRVRPLAPANSMQLRAHTGNPAALLTLAHELFGRSPPAWWVTVPAFDLGFGEKLSVEAQETVPGALESLRALWVEIQHPS